MMPKLKKGDFGRHGRLGNRPFYGLLTVAMGDVVRTLVTGKVVHDFGAGDLTLSRELLELGAARVIAIDCRECPVDVRKLPAGIEYHEQRFEDSEDLAVADIFECDIAFLSWPINNASTTCLLGVLRRARVIIYLGCNTGTVSCGTPALFQHMLTRKLIAYVPNKKNSLVCCGEALDVPRAPTWEEMAGIEWIRWYEYDAEQQAIT